MKIFRGNKSSRFRSVREIFLAVDGYAWSVPSVQSTMRYRESQVSLAVVDRAFTPGGVDYADSSIITAYFIFRVLNIRGWSQPQIILTAKFFRSTVVAACAKLDPPSTH